jgi:signal transduction histidine kinase/CheY-like chemotaxis protein
MPFPPVARIGVLMVALSGFLFAGEEGWPQIERIDAASPFHGDASLHALAETADGRLLAGGERLAAFDGHRWTTVATPGLPGIRSLAAGPDGRVYLGGDGEIGIAEITPEGGWHFHLITPALRAAGLSRASPVWFSYASATGAWFITSTQLLRWDGHEFSLVRSVATSRRQSGVLGRQPWVYQPGEGLLGLGDAPTPSLLIADSDLPARPVLWAAHPLAADPNASPETLRGPGLVIGAGTAAYRRTAQGWQELAALSVLLRERLPVRAETLPEGDIVIGTFLGGLVRVSGEGETPSVVDTQVGLPEDTVTTLLRDSGGRLWVGLGGGLARVEGLGTVSRFDSRNGLGTGAVRKVIVHDDQPFVLTSRHLLAVAPQGSRDEVVAGRNRLMPTHELKAVLWDAASGEGGIWLGGFGGIWTLSPSASPLGFTPEHRYHVSEDVSALAMTRSPGGGLHFVQDHTPMRLFPTPNGWAARAVGALAQGEPRGLLEDDAGDVWLPTAQGEVLRFTPSRSEGNRPAGLQLSQRFRAGQGLPAETGAIRLTAAGGTLYAWTDRVALRLDAGRTRFLPVEGMRNHVPVAAAALGDALYWLIQAPDAGSIGSTHQLLVADPTKPDETARALAVPGLAAFGPASSLQATRTSSGDALWISGRGGLLRVNPARLRPPLAAVAPVLREVTTEPAGEPFDARSLRPILPSTLERIAFRFSAGAAVERPVYQTWLEGAEHAWAPHQIEPLRVFTGLGPGTYRFHVRSVGATPADAPEVVFPFEIATPALRQPWALAAYGVLALAGVGALVRWRFRRLRQSHEKLERLVTERTRELALANTAKSEFLENVSHELRNPLAGVVGLVGMLKEDRLQPEERAVARSLRASSEQLRRVMEDVLSFSKFEYGAVAVKDAPLHLREVLAEIRDLHATDAAARGIVLTIEWPEEVADAFLGDAGKIKTILGNFVGNALKYAPGAPVAIRVDAEDDGAGAVDVNIDVTDEGPGVPPEEQGLIFQKFVRGAGAKASGAPGTGIGLAACRALARLMGGSVGVENHAPHGATFFLRLKLRRATGHDTDPVTPAAASVERSASTTTAAVSTSPETHSDADAASVAVPTRPLALVVEDQAYNATVLAAIATELGYSPRIASRVTIALGLLKEADFAVVFLDWDLPDGKGDTVVRALRQAEAQAQPETPASPRRALVLATTAHDSEAVWRRCRESDMDGFVLKPYNIERIRTLIADARSTTGPALPVTEEWDSLERCDAGDEALDLRALELWRRQAKSNRDPVDAYLTALEEELHSARDALRAADADGVARAAHRLRTHAGIVGAGSLRQYARKLEERALGRTLRAAEDECTSLATAGEDLKAQVRRQAVVADGSAQTLSPKRSA